MSEPTNETGLVKRITAQIKKQYPDVVIYNIHGGMMQEAGIPDLLVLVNGAVVGLEVKFRRPGESEAHARNRASPAQRMQIERIIRSGSWAGVVLSSEEALEKIEAHLSKLYGDV